VAQSLAALAWLKAQGCRQIIKYCSTFDSTPDGNIGRWLKHWPYRLPMPVSGEKRWRSSMPFGTRRC